MRFSSRLMVFMMLLLLTMSATFVVSMAGCSGDDDDDDDNNDDNDDNDDDNDDDDAGDDDDDDDDDTGDDDDDDGTGCAPITDPFPPQDQIYQFLDTFTSMADYVTSYQGDIVAMGQMMEGTTSANSFQVQFPQDYAPGEYDMRWDEDPETNPIMAVYMKGVNMSGTYEKAFYVYRGCMTIEETGVEGENFRATFTDMYMTEAEIDLNSGQISIVTPGEGFQAFIMDMAIECHIAPYSASPGMGDLCMNM